MTKKNTSLIKSDKPKMIKSRQLINWQFSVEEMAEQSQSLARESIALAQLEKDKKEIVDEFKSKESKCKAIISSLSQKISNRYEMRMMDVMMHKDFDGGVKIFYDIKTGNELQRDKLTADDYQLDLEETEAASKV